MPDFDGLVKDSKLASEVDRACDEILRVKNRLNAAQGITRMELAQILREEAIRIHTDTILDKERLK